MRLQVIRWDRVNLVFETCRHQSAVWAAFATFYAVHAHHHVCSSGSGLSIRNAYHHGRSRWLYSKMSTTALNMLLLGQTMPQPRP